MGNGICGNQMCWQLSGNGRVGWGALGRGLFHFGHQSAPPLLPRPMELFPYVSALTLIQLCMESFGERGRGSEISILYPFPFCRYLFSAPASLSSLLFFYSHLVLLSFSSC